MQQRKPSPEHFRPDDGRGAAPIGAPASGRRPGVVRRLMRNAPGALVAGVGGAIKVLVIAGVLAVALFGSAILAYRSHDPSGSTLMAWRRLSGEAVEHSWVGLDRISPFLVRSVIAAEDGRFCSHRGVDFVELDAAMKAADRAGDEIVRGASTITMQTVKNLMLWHSRSYLRKGLEIPLAIALDAAWPKSRIIEVYLNISEWGPGVFGAEAAARYHFGKPAARLSATEAALLAAALPNPLERNAGRPGPGLRRVAATIETRARSLGTRALCVPGADRAPGAPGKP